MSRSTFLLLSSERVDGGGEEGEGGESASFRPRMARIRCLSAVVGRVREVGDWEGGVSMWRWEAERARREWRRYGYCSVISLFVMHNLRELGS